MYLYYLDKLILIASMTVLSMAALLCVELRRTTAYVLCKCKCNGQEQRQVQRASSATYLCVVYEPARVVLSRE